MNTGMSVMVVKGTRMKRHDLRGNVESRAEWHTMKRSEIN